MYPCLKDKWPVCVQTVKSELAMLTMIATVFKWKKLLKEERGFWAIEIKTLGCCARELGVQWC